MNDDEAGTVVCNDFTRGHRAPITMSRVFGWQAYWGRQDASVYVLAGFFFFSAVALIYYRYDWFVGPFGLQTGLILMAVALFAIPALAGFGASVTGMNIRDWPLWIAAAGAMVSRAGSAGVTSEGRVRREPNLRLRSRPSNGCWQLPE